MGRNKNKSKNTSPNLVPSSRLYLIPDTSTSYLPGGTGGWGINFASNDSSCSLSSPIPVWGPSHRRFSIMNCSNMSPCRLELFKHCSSMSPFLLVHSFRSRLLQHGFHIRLQVLPENLLQCGPAWAMVPASNLLCHGVPVGCTAHPPILVSSTVPQRGYLLHYGLLRGLQGTLCSSIWSIPFTPILTLTSHYFYSSQLLHNT